jgi:hypothetical protein
MSRFEVTEFPAVDPDIFPVRKPTGQADQHTLATPQVAP